MELNLHPSIRQLRTFGLTSLVALPLAAALWSRGSMHAIAYAAAAGAALAVIALVWPRGLRPLLVAINVVTWPVVMIVHDAVLLVAFFGMIVPVGMMMRLFGRDALQLKIDRNAASYWQPKRGPPEREATLDVGKEFAMSENEIMPDNEFEKASQEKPVGIVREFLQFLAANKKWWLLPIVVVLVACSLLAVIAATAAHISIYSLY